jgi:ubiquitin carboxyl-terminal hydrolase 48
MLLLANYCDGCFRMCEETRTLFGDLFGGNHNIGISCDVCKSLSNRKELFYVLQVPLSESVLESLSKATVAERLEGDNMYECGVCNVRTHATRSTQLLAPVPPILVLQMIRFHYDVKTFNKIKKMTRVSAPRVLDMSPFVDVASVQISPESLVYELYAVILHIGNSAHGGHYVAHVLQEDLTWVEMDDEETRALLPEEVGLTVSMRGSASKKGEEWDDEGGGEDAEFDPDAAEAPAKSRRTGKGANNKKKKGQPDAPAEDLVNNTKGSPAPYLFFYRVRQNVWAKLPPVAPPAYALTRVEAENVAMLADHRGYELICEETNRELDELYALHSSVVGECAMDNFFWLSLSWLKTWAAKPEADNVPEIDNSVLLCPHGKLAPSALPLMKRVSVDSWNALIQRYKGGPCLGVGSECNECIADHCRAELLVAQEDALIEEMRQTIQQGECGAKGQYFQISAEWLDLWKKSPKSAKLDEAVNGKNVICCHGGIRADVRVFRVRPKTWEYFSTRWPNAQALPGNIAMCGECFEMDEALQKLNEAELQKRKAQARKLEELLVRKNPYVLTKLEGGKRMMLVAREWVEKFRAFVKDPTIPALEPVQNSSLLCPHGLMKYCWKAEVQANPDSFPLGQLRSFFLVTEDQWKYLEEEFKLDGPSIALFNAELSLGECEPCVRSLIVEEAEAAKSFVKKAITIRQVDTGRSTNSKYQFRKKQKASGAGGGGSAQFKIDASATDTVEMLKLAIFNVTDTEPARISLQFGSTLLEDDWRNLNSYGIGAGAVVEMTTMLYDGKDESDVERPASQRSGPPNRSHNPEKGFQGSVLNRDFNRSSSSDDQANAGEGEACQSCTFVFAEATCPMCDTPAVRSKKKSKSHE